MSTDVSAKSRPAIDSPERIELVHVGRTLQSLQHLRVVAASFIVLYHTELQITRLTDGIHQHSLGFGAAGTDLFFVIGGFILVYTSHNRKDTFGAFLYRRFVRIAPLYWLFTSLMLVVLLIAPSHLLTTKGDFWHFLLSLAFIPYPHPVLGIDRPFLFPGWVLNHFAFFYLLFGSLLFLSTGKRVFWVSAVLCALVVLRALFGDKSHLLNFYGATVALDFVLGMIVAWLFFARNEAPWVIVAVFLAGASIFVAGVLHNVSEGAERAFSWGVADAALLFVCVSIEKQLGWPECRFLSKLGDASYSVFVSHLFTLALVTSILRGLRLFPALGVSGARIVFLGAAWALGMMIYAAIERPLMRYLDRRRRPRAKGLIVEKGP
ncbi:acyltransferase family protein [Bradyrhizobium australiense]|uniref:Acyltransferase n=1 Tax=Bradyrhizobium australiense TaxID=2721161 RepID=A0A7Y4GY02_9BRAD|nr:acyltransferase [Bradyrhizobium australiense]NOJ43714.1 acyltransferase [Bradyrhizobium australiense]